MMKKFLIIHHPSQRHHGNLVKRICFMMRSRR